jgi:TonB family protein
MTDVILRVRAQRTFSVARKTPIHKPAKLVIEFAIHRDGNLEYTRLISTSSDQEIDQALIDAIQAAAPFQPLSPEFKDKALKLRWHMEFKPAVIPSSSL